MPFRCILNPEQWNERDSPGGKQEERAGNAFVLAAPSHPRQHALPHAPAYNHLSPTHPPRAFPLHFRPPYNPPWPVLLRSLPRLHVPLLLPSHTHSPTFAFPLYPSYSPTPAPTRPSAGSHSTSSKITITKDHRVSCRSFLGPPDLSAISCPRPSLPPSPLPSFQPHPGLVLAT